MPPSLASSTMKTSRKKKTFMMSRHLPQYREFIRVVKMRDLKLTKVVHLPSLQFFIKEKIHLFSVMKMKLKKTFTLC
jgi:hypothetical protein